MNTLDAIEMMHEAHSRVRAESRAAAWRFVVVMFCFFVVVLAITAS